MRRQVKWYSPVVLFLDRTKPMVYPRYLESNASLRTEDIFIHFDAEFIICIFIYCWVLFILFDTFCKTFKGLPRNVILLSKGVLIKFNKLRKHFYTVIFLTNLPNKEKKYSSVQNQIITLCYKLTTRVMASNESNHLKSLPSEDVYKAVK